MSALDRLITLEKSLPVARGFKVRTIATIRLGNSFDFEYIEVELDQANQPYSARLFADGDSQMIPTLGKLWDWIEEIVESNV